MLTVFNTLTRKKELFEPGSRTVSVYHCGPTVYWTQHIGNIRAMTCGDLARRSFLFLGYDVRYVRNYTDVGHLTSDADEGEDKMEKGVRREGLSPDEIAQKYIAQFERDTKALRVLEPDVKPRATDHIPEMIEMVKTLLEKGYAYTTDLAIYYDVSKFPAYTALSGQKMEELEHGAGKGEIHDPAKRHPADFVLWFFRAGSHKNAIQHWHSPFSSPLVKNGDGFPGWHIECSAMAKKYLGGTIDVHMGGIEHIPIHHTNEIAQSEAANGVQFARYWLHNGHLFVDDGKMSKSEGTGVTVEDITARGIDPLALRYFFLQAHYRAKQNFTWDALLAAERGLENLYMRMRELRGTDGMVSKQFMEKFRAALEDDLNIPGALAVAYDLLRSDEPDDVKRATLIAFDAVFGLDLGRVAREGDEIPEELAELAAERERMRAAKKFKEADALRAEIEKKGYMIKDTGTGSVLVKQAHKQKTDA